MVQKRASSKKSATRVSKKSTLKRTAAKKSAPKRGGAKKSVTAKSKSVPKKKAKFAFGVTTITSISNYSSSNAKLTNTQYGNVVNAPPNDATPSRIEIPWADDAATAWDRHLTIEIGGTPKYYLFQKSGVVVYCTTLVENLKAIPGYSQGDGERILTLRSETFEIERSG